MLNTLYAQTIHTLTSKSIARRLVIFVVCAIFLTQTARLNADESPPEKSNHDVQFEAYDTPPQIVGGFKELEKNIIYPEDAKKAGIEGRVIVELFLDKQGGIAQTKIIKSLKNAACDSAAVQAIKQVKWKPAKKGEKPVAASVAVPIVFKLK